MYIYCLDNQQCMQVIEFVFLSSFFFPCKCHADVHKPFLPNVLLHIQIDSWYVWKLFFWRGEGEDGEKGEVKEGGENIYDKI